MIDDDDDDDDDATRELVRFRSRAMQRSASKRIGTTSPTPVSSWGDYRLTAFSVQVGDG
jgi:hypothetical protein